MSPASSPLKSHLIQLQHPLNLSLTLLCGQVFRFRQISSQQKDDDSYFEGSINNRLFRLQQSHSKELLFTPLSVHPDVDDTAAEENDSTILAQFFNLHLDTPQIHTKISNKCKFYEKIHPYYEGLQLVSQKEQVWECIVAFITSSNNNVGRIMKIMNSLAERYGKAYDRRDSDGKYYAFPEFADLAAQATEQDLREDVGMGYRAKFIIGTLRHIESKGGIESFIEECRKAKTSNDLIEKLMELPGVGRKVASCIALYAFDKTDVVPLDVHMLRRANQFCYFTHLSEMDRTLKQKFIKTPPGDKIALNDPAMKKVMDVFRKVFDDHAGHAQLYLYASLVGDFKKLLPDNVRLELEEMRESMLQDLPTEDETTHHEPPKKKRRISQL